MNQSRIRRLLEELCGPELRSEKALSAAEAATFGAEPDASSARATLSTLEMRLEQVRWHLQRVQRRSRRR